MKTICLYFEIHQITHLKRYRFFDIGTDHYYYDDYENERSINDIAERSYMPALNAIQEMIEKSGQYFKVAFSLSGVGMEQLELHAPQVLEVAGIEPDRLCRVPRRALFSRPFFSRQRGDLQV